MLPRPYPKRQRNAVVADGRPAFPVILLAGSEGSGKTWTVAEASASPAIGRTFVLTTGEVSMNAYGAIPGSRIEMLQHDGTYLDMLDAMLWARSQPKRDGKPTLLALDSGSVFWEFLKDEQQFKVNQRRNRSLDDPATITGDGWSAARKRWYWILDTMREHAETGGGPALITARFNEVTAYENGQPTPKRSWSVVSEKNLPYDVTVVMQSKGPGADRWEIAKVKAAKWDGEFVGNLPEGAIPKGETVPFPGFTVEKLLKRLGIDADTKMTGPEDGVSFTVRPEAIADEIPYDENGAFDPVEFMADFEVAMGKAKEQRSEDPIRGLVSLYTWDVIARSTVTHRDTQVNAGELVRTQLEALRRWIAQDEVPVGAPTAAPAPQAPAEPTSAPAPAPGPDSMELYGLTEKDARDLLAAEISGHIHILKPTSGTVYTQALRNQHRRPDGRKASSVADVPLVALVEWVAGQRRFVAERLTADGNLPAAQELLRAPVAPIVWAAITELMPQVPEAAVA